MPRDLAPVCVQQHSLLTKIVYRQDLHSQFQDFAALRRFLDDNGANVDDGGHPIPKLDTRDVVLTNAKKEKVVVTESDLMRHYGLDFFVPLHQRGSASLPGLCSRRTAGQH